MNAMHPFAGNVTFPKSVYNALINGMPPALLRIFRKHYPDHSMLHDMNSTFQRSRFPLIMAAMIAAKEEVASISAIVQETIGGQVFATSTPAFASQAKRTLDRYAPGEYSSEGSYLSDGGGYWSNSGCSESSRGSRGELRRCGCQGLHPYMQNKVIVCSNKDKPGVKEAANANYKEWLKLRKKFNKKRKEKSISYKKLSDKDKAQMRKSILASLCVSNATNEALRITANSSTWPPPAKKANMTILVINVSVLLSASPSKNPHIHIQLGSKLNNPSCLVICCIVNTATALMTGNFHFVAAIAKRYPHCVAKIFAPKDYNPIVLSGIVSAEANQSRRS